MENGNATEGKDPSTFLSEIAGAPVTVKLNSGVVYRGTIRTKIFWAIWRSLTKIVEKASSSLSMDT